MSGASISSVAFNTLITDIYTEITNSVDRAGRSSMTAALPMGGQKITGMADPTVSTDATTKAYVDALVAIFFSTGDIKPTLKSVPDSGWLTFDDGTFGSASSGSSNSNSAANLNLFTLLFNSPFTDANIPILTSGGGATTRAAQVSASAAWTANCRMSLPKAMGRAFGAAGAGSALTARILGQTVGLETTTLGGGNLPPYTPSGNLAIAAHVAISGVALVNSGGATTVFGGGGSTPVTFDTATFTGNAQGGTSVPFSIMQPITFVNWMVKQ